jgi:hypothetical protein
MTKTSASSSRFAKAALFAGLVLVPQGELAPLVKDGKPWHGFHANDPVLWVARAQVEENANCAGWLNAMKELPLGARFDPAKPEWNEWEEWSDEDLDAVKDCDDFPCEVKLNRAEVAEMAKAGEETRKATFLSLVRARVTEALKSGKRKEYEFAGDPVDPWAGFEAAGFKTELKPGEKPELWIRKLNLAPGKFRPFRQILERRDAASATEATMWVRDLYDAHYFDSWGEWMDVRCDPATKRVTIVQAILVELDLLKKHDLFSSIARPRMRSAVQEIGRKYLDRMFENLRRLSTVR